MRLDPNAKVVSTPSNRDSCSTPPDVSRERRHRILIVGNFLSAATRTRGVCEELADRLAKDRWEGLRTSRKVSRATRLVDMASTAWRERKRYEIAQVDVFSGNAFRWAEVVCWVLRQAAKPYILTLHGGNLPAFSRERPKRVRRMMKAAAAVTVPSSFLLEEMSAYRG